MEIKEKTKYNRGTYFFDFVKSVMPMSKELENFKPFKVVRRTALMGGFLLGAQHAIRTTCSAHAQCVKYGASHHHTVRQQVSKPSPSKGRQQVRRKRGEIG